MASNSMGRRTVLAGALLAPLGVTLARAGSGGVTSGASATLVAYMTRTGNTQVIAGTLHRTVGGELFEIRTAQPYPADYEATVEQARRERDAEIEPSLAERFTDIAQVDMIFLGFPIWGETAPPPIRSFLRMHDLTGKTVRPFITHGGYGIGDAMEVLRKHAPDAYVEAPFVMEADQERRTLNQIRSWLETIDIA